MKLTVLSMEGNSDSPIAPISYKKTARIITGSDYDASSEPLLLELGLRNIWELITCDTVVMMHKSKYNLAPEYIKFFPAK